MIKKNYLDSNKRKAFSRSEIKLLLIKMLKQSLNEKYNTIQNSRNKNSMINNIFSKELLESNVYFQFKMYLLKKINKIPNKSFKTKISNRCIWTGRSKGVLSKYRISRIIFKKYASNKQLPGFYKYSW